MNVRTLVPPDMDERLDEHATVLPSASRQALLDYLRFGLRPGHFLTAVLSNDLVEACVRADEENRRALYDYVFFLHYYAPADAWGSPAHVTEWLQYGAELREGQTEVQS